MEAAGFLSIKANNLIPSSNSVISVPNLNFDLASTGTELFVKDLSVPQVATLEGNVVVWSGVFTNYTGNVTTNIGPDPNDPTLMVTNVSTNVIEIDFHALFVDAQLFSAIDVLVNDLILRGSNVTFADNMLIARNLFLDGESMTIQPGGRIALSGGSFDSITRTNAPNLLYLTNFGILSAPSKLEFGSSETPMASLVNRSNLSSSTIQVYAKDFQNSGALNIQGPGVVEAAAAKFEGGSISAQGDLFFRGADFKLRQFNQNSATLYISVTNSLGDNGGGSGNVITCREGFHLLVRPPSGDLLGTSFRTTAQRFALSRHTWAGEDRGPTPAGFTNNVALGRLTIDAQENSFLTFSGVGAANGLYVDRLDFAPGLTNALETYFSIDPNLVIYFADSTRPAEEIDGAFDGRLRWVRDFAGPNSGVDVLLRSGQTVRMNRALRESPSLDSDGDGLANRFDLYPLDPDSPAITNVVVTASAPLAVSFSVPMKTEQVYQIEYTTNLVQPVWNLLGTYTNLTPSGAPTITLQDPLPAGDYQRYYRVRYNNQ
jgi:hypothetical protein